MSEYTEQAASRSPARRETEVTRHAGQPSRTEGASRRPYTTPRLDSLGPLSRMTRFGGSDIVDSGSGLGPNP